MSVVAYFRFTLQSELYLNLIFNNSKSFAIAFDFQRCAIANEPLEVTTEKYKDIL